jgi:hypothetical protein
MHLIPFNTYNILKLHHKFWDVLHLRIGKDAGVLFSCKEQIVRSNLYAISINNNAAVNGLIQSADS